MWTPETAINFEEDVRFLTMVANLIAQTVKLHERLPADRLAVSSSDAAGSRIARKRAARNYEIADVIGRSQAMQQLFAQVHLVAPTKSTVVLRGESGTGKEVIARAIHTLSPRKQGPFIKVNCAVLPDTLLESELFGHEKGLSPVPPRSEKDGSNSPTAAR